MSNCSGCKVASLLTRMFLPVNSSKSVSQRALLDLRDLTVSGLHTQQHVAVFEVLAHLAQLGEDLVADGGGALDHACRLADGARDTESALQRLLYALAGDGNEAEIIKLQDLCRRAIIFQRFFERGHAP